MAFRVYLNAASLKLVGPVYAPGSTVTLSAFI